MKSIQDLCIFQNILASKLQLDDISIEIHTDKSFSIWNQALAEPQLLIDNEQLECDINDFPYMNLDDVAKQIADNMSVADIQVSDL